MNESNKNRSTENDIAIIGMAGRFPGANSVAEFWDNLVAGKETIKTFGKDDLLNIGFPEKLLENPSFVPCRGIIDNIDLFDAEFFSYSPREAELLDPQQRVFLECAWTAMEDAGYDSGRCTHAVGVFAGSNQNTYQLFHVLDTEESLYNVHGMSIYADKDFLSTRVSYKLNLHKFHRTKCLFNFFGQCSSCLPVIIVNGM